MICDAAVDELQPAGPHVVRRRRSAASRALQSRQKGHCGIFVDRQRGRCVGGAERVAVLRHAGEERLLLRSGGGRRETVLSLFESLPAPIRISTTTTSAAAADGAREQEQSVPTHAAQHARGVGQRPAGYYGGDVRLFIVLLSATVACAAAPAATAPTLAGRVTVRCRRAAVLAQGLRRAASHP